MKTSTAVPSPVDWSLIRWTDNVRPVNEETQQAVINAAAIVTLRERLGLDGGDA